MTYQDILIETTKGIGTITLNRPEKLNAFRSQTISDLILALQAAIQDRAVGVIIVTGAGGKAFCVGGDISEMKTLNRKTGGSFVQKLLKLGKLFFSCPKPIIAKVNGYCIGGGNEIQLFCDLTIASERSVFAQTGPKVGSAPLWGGGQILPGLIGMKKAKEVAFLCRQYPAMEAKEIGMINQVVPETDLDRVVEETCKELLQRSPQAIRLLKKSFHAGLLSQLQKDLKNLAPIYGTAELQEGMNAFLEKRSPDYSKFR